MKKIENFNEYNTVYLFQMFRAVVYIKGTDELFYDEIESLRYFISKQEEITYCDVEDNIDLCTFIYSDHEKALENIREYDQETKQFAADFITEFFIAMPREEDEKERLLEVFRKCQLPMPQNEEYQLILPAGELGEDEQYELEAVSLTFIAIHYYEINERKIPGDYRKYTPCLIQFLQDKDQLGDSLNFCYNTPDLNRITDSLDSRNLNVLNRATKSNLTIAILYNKNGNHGYNKIMGNTELTGVFPRVFVETCYVALIDKDNPSDWNKITGFFSKTDIRKVLRELDKLVYGLAFNGPVYDQPALKQQMEAQFWAEEVENQLDELMPFIGVITEADRKERIKAVLDFKEWMSKSIGESNPQTTEGDKSCTFGIIATDQNTVVNGEFMFNITTGFNIKGCQGDECVCTAYFYDNDGNFMTCDDEDYATSKSKQMNCRYHFTPKYNDSNFSGVELTIPMRLLYKSARSLANKKQPYRIELSIYDFTIGEFLPSDPRYMDFYLPNV